MIELDTYPKYLLRNSKLWPDKVALRHKDYGIWQTHTYRTFYQKVESISLGLVSLGLQPGDRVALIGDDESEALWAEVAIPAARGIMVAMWSDSVSSEIEYIVGHSESKFIIAEDQEQVDKILEISGKIPEVQKVVYWDPRGIRGYDDPILMSLESLMRIGSEYKEAHPGIFEALVASGKGDDIAQLTYTSGTTGLPKASEITYSNLIGSAKLMQEFIHVSQGEDLFSTIAQASIFHGWFIGFNFIRGAVINFAEEPETVVQDYREISPRTMLVGPRQWQSLYSMVETKVNDAGFLKRFFYKLALPVGYKMVDLRISQRKSLLWKLLYKLADILVFAAIRDKLGLVKTRCPISGGAFMSPDFFRFFQAIGVNIIQAYGSTEAGMISMHSRDDIDIQTVGRIGENVATRITDEQEILIAGEGVFSGYYKDSEKNKEVFDGGWFRTGDAGFLNEQGHLCFIDRVSDLEELSGGQKYAPGYLEGTMKFSRFMRDVLVIGGRERNYLSAIIGIDFDSVGKWAETNRIPYTTFVDLSQKDEISEHIRKEIQKLNKGLPEGMRLHKFVLLHKEFDPDEAELTRTRKLRRAFLQDRYRDLINAIYEDKRELPVVAEVKYRDGRRGTVQTSIKIRSV